MNKNKFKGCTILEWEIKTYFTAGISLEEIVARNPNENHRVCKTTDGNYLISGVAGDGAVKLSPERYIRYLELLIEDYGKNKTDRS